MNAERLMLTGGICAFLLTLHWVRSRDLLERYAVTWMTVALLLVVCGLYPNLIMVLAGKSRLSYPAAVLFVALAVIYMNALSVSVALTRHHRRTLRLIQEVALLQAQVRRLEAAQGEGGTTIGPPEDDPRSSPPGLAP